MSVVLASGSPRRKELLEMLGVKELKIIPAKGEESAPADLGPGELVMALAAQKGREVRELCSEDDVIIAADTIVWHDGGVYGKPRSVEHAKEKGYVVTLFGRRRPVPELASSNFMQRAFGERVAMNSPIQGTAADIMKIAMIGVNRRLKEAQMKSRLVLQVHDELLIEAHRDEVEQVKEILAYEMEHAASLLVPLDVDMHVGDNWYEAK